MRRTTLACSLLGTLFLASCSSADGYGPADGPVGAAEGRIAFGTPDSKHTAVVTVLEPAGSNEFAECSGSIVRVSGGKATVLTAAHCCNTNAPTIVSTSADYAAGEQALFGGPINPPVYAVDAASIYYDAQFDMNNLPNGHDFCMFQFATSTSFPTLALPASCNDGVADGVQVEHVGFGETDTNTNNTGRNTGTDAITSFDNNTISWNQGDAQPSHAGTCEGDSGGPALTPAGAAQSAQTIVATTSFGGNVACGASNQGTGARVCSEMGSGGFISSYLAGSPIGNTPGSSSSTSCSACATAAESGACASQTQACGNDAACVALDMCLGSCMDQTCANACASTAGTTAVNEFNALQSCFCNTACVSECSSQCGGSSSSSSGGSCGLMSSVAACTTCIDASCCNQGAACAADPTCVSCLVANPPASCQSDGPFIAFADCLNGSCASPCGGGSSTSSSSGSATTSSTSTSTSASSGSASTSSGSMGSGNGGGGGGSAGPSGSGAAAGTSSGGVISTKASCSVGGTGTDAGDAGGGGGPFAGLLLALGLAVSRRRRG